MLDKAVIGKRIKEIRERQQLQQIDVAKKLNITQSTLAKYESGVNLPSIINLAAIAKICEASIDEFISEPKFDKETLLVHINIDESRLINKFRALPPEKQKALLSFLSLK